MPRHANRGAQSQSDSHSVKRGEMVALRTPSVRLETRGAPTGWVAGLSARCFYCRVTADASELSSSRQTTRRSSTMSLSASFMLVTTTDILFPGFGTM